jgi:hypothetical protein
MPTEDEDFANDPLEFVRARLSELKAIAAGPDGTGEFETPERKVLIVPTPMQQLVMRALSKPPAWKIKGRTIAKAKRKRKHA